MRGFQVSGNISLQMDKNFADSKEKKIHFIPSMSTNT